MPWTPPQTVVAPVDFSPESFAAVESAVDIAGDSAKVHVVHVLPELSAADPGVIWQTADDEKRAAHVRDALHEKLADPKFQNVQIHVAVGDPGHRVAQYAEELEADLIVISSHGRRGLRRLLIGSVAERVIRLAHCPVLVLRT
jgi:nucleotide-binding universal stress UspA family protein